jgi:opacity protein-like surface antigen
MQQHQNAFLTYNFETQAHEAYYITKKIAEKHWKPFVTLGMGVDFCLKSNWAISLSVNARQALKTQYLLENEKRLVFINMGLKYKF